MSCFSSNIIMQGDQYSIAIKIKQNGNDINIENVVTIQILIGDLVKHWRNDGTGEVIYDENTHEFLYPVLQEETFAMEGDQDIQIRIRFTNGEIKGTPIGTISINYTKTKESI